MCAERETECRDGFSRLFDNWKTDFSVCDSFDAMSSRRIYRDSLPLNVVHDEIQKNLGTQFDPELGAMFLDIIDNEYDKIQEIKDKYK